jgi:hypothetical protein
MLRSIMIVAAAAGLLAVGAMSAVAGTPHGKPVGTLATSTTVKGNSISAIARATKELQSSAARLNANGNAAPAATQAQAQPESDSETAEDATDAHDNDATDEAAPAAPATNTEQQGAEHDD